jgi:carbonic anhydrase
MNKIPLASLAAILLVTGYKLAKISLFKEMFKKGMHQFIPFIITVIAIVFTDLLIGILIGLGFSIFFLLRNNYRNPFALEKHSMHIGEVIRIELADQVTFLNKASMKDSLWSIEKDSKVIIDATQCEFIDDDVIEVIQEFQKTYAPENNIQVNIVGLKKKYALTDHVQFLNVLDKAAQKNLKHQTVLKLLMEGNQRFVKGGSSKKFYRHQVDATSSGQNPMAVVLGCIDSRTAPEIIFDAGIGDLLSIRIAGNIVSPEIIGSLELAVREIGTKLILVKGHSNCGAIKASILQMRDENIGRVTEKIADSFKSMKPEEIDVKSETSIETITRRNVEFSIRSILQQSPYLREQFENGNVGVIGAYYDTSSGKVDFFEKANNS